MTVIIEGRDRVYMGAQAWLVEEDRELAWAEKHVITNPALKYVLGRFVEADNFNSNGHLFDLKELETSQKYLANSPLNMLHRPHYIVGNYIGAELMYPTTAPTGRDGETLDVSVDEHPYVEALAAFYRYYFPEEYAMVEKAHADGALFYSMECVPKTVVCRADNGCGQEFAYDGRISETYCSHLNQPAAKKLLREPLFTGGALIVPPASPGWKKADITAISQLLTERQMECEMAYDQLENELPHLGPAEWEQMMALLVSGDSDISGFGLHGDYPLAYEMARDFNTTKRKQMAKEGTALPDGSYPIANVSDLKNAIQAFGRAPASKRAAVKAHIKKRANALGASNLIPDNWD